MNDASASSRAREGATGAVDESTFDLGLVLAGAVTAGAYTAGVLDFLIEALDEWERAKKRAFDEHGPDRTLWDVPGHEVRLRVVTGASAGALATFAGLLTLTREFAPMRTDPRQGGVENPLYSLWVTLADGQKLFQSKDLDADPRLKSVFDATCFEEALGETLALAARAPTIDRPWLDRALEVIFSATNLDGVPYSAHYPGGSVGVRTFADYVRFRLGDVAAADEVGLPVDDLGHDSWRTFAAAALASSAFPGALAPRPLSRDRHDYDGRLQLTPLHDGDPGEDIPPAWPPGSPATYEALYFDGGALNNSPVELARRSLSGNGNHSGPDEARRAVVLVNPFPNDEPYRPKKALDPRLVSSLLAFGEALLFQSRFDPEEIARALDPHVATCFLVAPRRSGRIDGHRVGPLASAPLGAFGGALDEAFRRHDFFLGRRNCQRFLARWFALGPSNAVFVSSGGKARSKAMHHRGFEFDARDGHGPKRVVVPLVGTAAAPVVLPEWPQLDAERLTSAYRRPLRRRVSAVVSRALEEIPALSRASTVSRVVGGLCAPWLTRAALNSVRRQLGVARLLAR